MLEQWLRTAEQKKQEAIDKVRAVCTDKETIDLAIKEIDVNHRTLQTWLKRMNGERYSLNDDLSPIEEDYNNLEGYRLYYNHIMHHLSSIINIPSSVEEETFKPVFARLC